MKSLGTPFKRKNFITLLQRYIKNDINHYLMMNACCRKTQSCIKYVDLYSEEFVNGTIQYRISL